MTEKERKWTEEEKEARRKSNQDMARIAAKCAADTITRELQGTKYLPIFEKMEADGLFEKKTSNNTKRIISENYRLRFKVFKRDGFRCQYCGRSPKIDENVILHLDHIKPKAKGGTDEIDNLVTSCAECNIGKNDMEL